MPIDGVRTLSPVAAGVLLEKQQHERSRSLKTPVAILVAAVLPAVVYLAHGPTWLREDWQFVAEEQEGTLHQTFLPTRPVAWAIHNAVFGIRPTPAMVLILSTVALVVAALLFRAVLRRWLPTYADAAALVWVALPIHTSMSWWASGLYITIAAALALQSLRVDGRRGAWWVLAAGLCYEATVLPVVIIGVWRRQWWHAGAGTACLGWTFWHRPESYGFGLIDPLLMLKGGFGLSISAILGAVILAMAVRHRDRVEVRVGLLLGVGGVLPFAAQGWDITFDGVRDRANVTAAFGVALVLAGLARRHLPVVAAALVAVTMVHAIEYGRAADDVDRALCTELRPAGYGPVQGLTEWNLDEAEIVGVC